VAAAEDDVPDIPGASMQLAMSRLAMFLLLNVSSDTLHSKLAENYSHGDFTNWARAILAQRGPGRAGPGMLGIAGRLFRFVPRAGSAIRDEGRDRYPDCPVSSHSDRASVDTGFGLTGDAADMMLAVVGLSGPASAAPNVSSGKSASFCHRED
jgi:hypothetical protein